MPSDVDDVIRATEYEVVTVRITDAPVKGGVHLLGRKIGPVGADVATIVTINGLHAARRQRPFNDDHAFFIVATDGTGSFIEQLKPITRHGHARTAQPRWLVFNAFGNRQHGPACLGLPVVIDDGHAKLAGNPCRRAFIQWLTREIQGFQGRYIVLAHHLGRLFFQYPHRGGCGEHTADFVFLNDLPPDAGVRPQRRAFVHDGGHAGNQRTIDDVRMSHYPADVGSRKISLAGLAAKNGLHGCRQRNRIPTDIALHALGLAGGAGGVKNVGDICRIEPDDGHARIKMLSPQGSVVNVASGHERHRYQAAIDEQYMRRLVRRKMNRFIQQGLVRHRLTTTRTSIAGYDQLGTRIINTGGQTVGRKAAKDDRMNRTNTRAREHRKTCLGNHRHVNQDDVTLAHAQRQHHRSGALDFGLQLAKCPGLLGGCAVRRFSGNGNQRRLIR